MESDWKLFLIPKWTLEPYVHPWENLIYPILELIGHLSHFLWSIYFFRDPWEVIGGCSPPQNGLWQPWNILYKIWYIIYKIYTSFTKFGISLKKKMVHPIFDLLGPLSYYPWSVHSFRDLWKVIGGRSLLWNKFWNPRYILKKIWYIQSLS